jgi:anti-sigma factor RsiW
MKMSVSNEELMRYLDGEVSPDERARIEKALAGSTELQRELSIYRAMQRDLADLPEAVERRSSSIWQMVNRRLTRPVGWILLVGGFLLWAGYGAWVFATSPANPVEKLAVGALAVGFLILLATTVLDRIQEWKHDPYRDIER